jgi:hypothetical protein
MRVALCTFFGAQRHSHDSPADPKDVFSYLVPANSLTVVRVAR